MPARRAVKPFAPKPNSPGATLSWTQVHADGTATERTGMVSSAAPQISGVTSLWVIPDHLLETDAYPVQAVLVLPANRSRHLAWEHDNRGNKIRTHRYAHLDPDAVPVIPYGGAVSEDSEYSPTGALVHGAASHAERTRRETA